VRSDFVLGSKVDECNFPREDPRLVHMPRRSRHRTST
jgi:hypothetical protein